MSWRGSLARVRVSLRYKLLVVLSGLVLLAVVAYLALATTLFTRDKLAYIYDLNAALVASLVEQTDAHFGLLVREITLLARQVGEPSATAETHAAAAADLFAREQDLVRVQFFEQEKHGLVHTHTFLNYRTLDEMGLGHNDLEAAHSAQPVPVDAVAQARGEIYVQNSSLPPDAGLLTLAFSDSAGRRVAVCDLRPQRLLRVFERSALHETYLVDDRGHVLVHPDARAVVEHRDMSQHALVAEALGSAVGQAVREFRADGSDFLGAFGTTRVGRLRVLAQIPREEALRTTHELVRRSLLFAVAVLLAAFIASVFFSRLLTAPITRLRAAMERFGRGEFDVQPDVRSNDEIGDLAASFVEMQRALRNKEAQLVQSEKLAAFGQLGAGITHEVKNPMTGIIGFAQLAQRKVEDRDKLIELLKVIEHEALRCKDILTNFLRFARTSTGERERLDLNQLVGDAARLMQHQLAVNKVHLELNLCKEAPMIVGSAPELQQVLLNLAINAQQAMPTGGRVVLSTHVREGNALICVRDTGPGVPAELRQRIFEPFFTTKRESEGTGLGLSISFSIVRAHEGTLSVDSAEGGGALFTIAVPIAPR